MPVGDLLPEIAIVLTIAVILISVSFLPRRLQSVGALLALFGLATAFALCVVQLGTPPRLAFSGVWAIDAASIWARLLILAATFLVVLASPGWFRDDRRHGEYYAILLLSTLGAMALAAATDMLQLVMGVLLSSITGYTLAAYHRDWAISVEAGMKYFLVGALANTLLIVGVTLLFGLLGETGYGAIGAMLSGTSSSPLMAVGLTLLVLGIAFKLGAVPVHSWLPDVAEGAPVPAAAFLTVVPKIGAAIALARLLALFGATFDGMRPLVATLAVATMTLGNLAALWQTDMRRLLGWSSVSQSGYALAIITVVGLGTQAVPALLVFLAGYAAANIAAFVAIAHLRGRTALADYQGLASRRPWVATALIVAMLSLVGIPPLGGFVGKLLLFLATIASGYAWLAAAAIANTVVSLFYYLRAIGPMYFSEPGTPVHVLGRGTGISLIMACCLVVALGLTAGLLLNVIPSGVNNTASLLVLH